MAYGEYLTKDVRRILSTTFLGTLLDRHVMERVNNL